jgi:transcription initiation factor TFIID subunit 15
MGKIPSNNNMISSIVLFPGHNEDIAANQAFDIQVQITNLVAGSFTDAQATYYSAPQDLKGGNIVGHCHVTVQDLGNNLTPTNGPDPKTFNFFKGIDDDGNGQGLLKATVANGLPAGFYRVCTMNSASNHQPVLMPVAQRGAQDDCNKFTVGKSYLLACLWLYDFEY